MKKISCFILSICIVIGCISLFAGCSGNEDKAPSDEMPIETPVEETPVEEPATEETVAEEPPVEFVEVPTKEIDLSNPDNVSEEMAIKFLKCEARLGDNDEHTIYDYSEGPYPSGYCLMDIDGDSLTELLVNYSEIGLLLVIDVRDGVVFEHDIWTYGELLDDGTFTWSLSGEAYGVDKITTNDAGELIVDTIIMVDYAEKIFTVNGKDVSAEEAEEAESTYRANRGNLIKYETIPTEYLP